MPEIKRFVGGIVRIEISTPAEQQTAAKDTSEIIEKYIDINPAMGLFQYFPDGLRRQRTKQVFVFGRLVHIKYSLDERLSEVVEFLKRRGVRN